MSTAKQGEHTRGARPRRELQNGAATFTEWVLEWLREYERNLYRTLQWLEDERSYWRGNPEPWEDL